MKVIVAKPFEVAEVVEINGSLESMQEIVGGYIEPYWYHEDVCIICNEEGKIKGLPACRALTNELGTIDEIICGPMIICAEGEEDFTGLTEEQIEKYMKVYGRPHHFYRELNWSTGSYELKFIRN